MKKQITHRIGFLILLFFAASSLFATKYYSKSTGDLDDITTWGDATIGDGSGNSPSNFAGSDEFVICNRTATDINATFGPGSGFWIFGALANASVTIGDGVNPINFSVYLGDEIRHANIQIMANATLTINDDNPDLNIFTGNNGLVNNSNAISPNSTVIYTTPSSSIIANVYGNLMIDEDSELLGFTDVLGLLTVASTKTLDLKTFKLNINAKVAGSGYIAASLGTIAVISQASSNSNGTLNIAGSPAAVKYLELTLGNGSFIALGTNVVVTNTYITSGGGQVDLNGNFLTLQGDITLSSSSASGYRGSSTSGIIVDGTGTVTANRPFRFNSSANTLKVLSINRASASFSIGNAVNILDSISVINGSLALGGGSLTLVSTTSLKARIGKVLGTLTGSLIVRTIIPGNKTGWANLGAPGVRNQTVASWDTYVSSGGTTGIPMTCQGCNYGVTGTGSYFESIQGWSETNNNYDTTLTNASALTPGKGFWVYVGNSYSTTTDLTLVNTGAAISGNTNIAISATSGSSFNLIANPYACPISWSRTYTTNTNSSKVMNAIYIWNADLGTSGLLSSYVAGASSPGGGAAGDVIPAGQGFFVQATTTGSLDFTEHSKVASNTGSDPLLRPAPGAYGQIFRVKLKGASGEKDETTFRIHPNATSGFDNEWDAHKIFQSPGYAGYPGVYNFYTTLSSKDSHNEDYSINSIALTSSVSIPILAKVTVSGTYTISGADLDQVSDCVMLYDRFLNKTQDLKLGDYVCTMSDTITTPRFDLLLCKEKADETGIKQQYMDAEQVLISKDANGAFVKTSFDKSTKAVISVYNLVGQKLCDDIAVEGAETTTRLNLGAANQIVFVKVTTPTETYTKKFLVQ